MRNFPLSSLLQRDRRVPLFQNGHMRNARLVRARVTWATILNLDMVYGTHLDVFRRSCFRRRTLPHCVVTLAAPTHRKRKASNRKSNANFTAESSKP
jgi:hypothetical protein